MILVCTESEQGGRKDRQRNEPVGSCATCDARSTGPSALEGKKIKKWRVKTKLSNTYKSSLLQMNGKTFFVSVW